MNNEAMEEFYDGFRDSRMLNYRLGTNRRLRLAHRFIRPQLARDSSVLEVGCGIGLTTRMIARRAHRGQVWALDLSSKNVDLARRIAKQENVQWRVLDILEARVNLGDWVGKPIDTIVLVDVLEHIPAEERELLFDRLLAVASNECRVLLTFPSVEYQRYLRREQPGELQPVDEDIGPEELASLGRQHNLSLLTWAYKDAWLTGQYVHAVLSRGHKLAPIRQSANPYWIPIRRKVAAGVRRVLAWRYRD